MRYAYYTACMDKKEAQAMFEKYTEEVKRHMGILMGDSNDKFKLLTEMFGGMSERLDGMDNKLDLVVEDVDELKTRMTSIEGRLTSVEGRVGGLEQKMDTVAADVKDIKEQMGEKVDMSTHLALEHRVTTLEH